MNDTDLTHLVGDDLIDAILKEGDVQNAAATSADKADPDPCDHLNESNPHRSTAALTFAGAFALERTSNKDARTKTKAELQTVSERPGSPVELQKRALAIIASGSTSTETQAEREAREVVDGVLQDMGIDIT